MAPTAKTTRNNNPVRYRVRKVKNRPHSPWVCDFFAHGKRLRKFFPSEELAWGEGARLTVQVTEHGTASLTEPEGGLTVSAAVRMFVHESEARSQSHREKLEIFHRAFVGAFRGRVADIQPAALRKWVKSRSPNGNTQAMYFRYMRMFFGYLKSNRLIDDDLSTAVPSPKTSPARNILTPQQMLALLDLEMHDHVRAVLLLGGFGGLRTEEMQRMDWVSVDVKTGQIHVPPGAMKDSGGFDQRIVDFTEPLTRRADWLAARRGPIIPVACETFHMHRRDDLRPVLAPWPDNCLRHSFATYHLGRAKSAGLTAFQMGHTDAKMVQRVYAVPAARADWRAWWDI